MEDIINSFNEEWINSILNYKLLETDNYALLINSLYPKVISKLSTHEYDIAKETSFSISVFAKQFAEYCDLRNQKLDVSFDEFLKIFEHYNTGIWHHEFDYVNLYNLFKHTYDSMNFDKLDDCNIAMTRFNILKRLFISNGLEERISNEMVEPDDFINSLMKEEGKQILLSVMNELTDREKKILMQRFGLDDGRAKTLEEVGKIYNATRERIRQIEAKALRKLRHPQRSKRLKEFVD